MKTLIISVTAVAALVAAPVLAADMPPAPVRMPVQAPAPSVYNWSGFYSASSLGGAWWDIKSDYVPPSADHLNSKASRGNYGSSYGLQYQWGNVVLGVEGTLNALFNNHYSTSVSPSADCVGSAANLACSSRVQRIWTVGGQLGWAADRWMVFGTGGYASGHIETLTSLVSAAGGNPAGTITSYTSDRNDGWYAGGEVEYYVGKFWWSDMILGAEYQHIRLNSKTNVDLVGVPANNRNVSTDIDIARARLVFKWTP